MLSEERMEMFVQTVREREKAMFRVAFVMLKRVPEAEDAVSAAVESAFRRLESIKNDDALPAYLMRCTVNACRDALRRRKRETLSMELESIAGEQPTEGRVWEYLCGLDEKYSLPIAMRYGDAMSFSEIAQALRLPTGTVSTRISRGLQLLRDQMEKGGA